MWIHNRKQKLRLGHRKSDLPFLFLHELAGLIDIPSALSLIKNNNLLDRSSIGHEVIVTEVMNVLNKRTGLLEFVYTFGSSSTIDVSGAVKGIDGKGFAQYIHQRAVSTEKDRVFIIMRPHSAVCDI